MHKKSHNSKFATSFLKELFYNTFYDEAKHVDTPNIVIVWPFLYFLK